MLMRMLKEDNSNTIQGYCVSEDELVEENRLSFKKWFADTRPELAHELITMVEEEIDDKVNGEIEWRKQKEWRYPEMSEYELKRQITRDIWLTILNEIMNSVFIWVDMERIQKKIDSYWRGCEWETE